MRCWPVTSRRSPSWFRSCCSLTVTHRTCSPMAEAAAVEAAAVEAAVVEAAAEAEEAAAEVVEAEAEASTDSCST